jgi:ABC-type antimicrobial peptide transport system permease subunit
VFSFRPTPKIIGTGLFVGVLLGLLGGIVPAIRAALIQPARAMRA